MPFTVAVVSGDEEVRRAAARAFSKAPLDWDVCLHQEPPASADVVVCGVDVPQDGDVVFDSDDPHAAVQRVEELRRARFIAGTFVVAGATGGSGATTVALHLAARWAPSCWYADVSRGGGAARRLDLPLDARTWLPGDEDLLPSALPVRGGFRVMLAPSPCPDIARFPLCRAAQQAGRLVLDVGTVGDIEPVLSGAAAAVLVVPPTRPGARRAAELLADNAGARWAVVTNRTGPGGQLMRSALEEVLGRPIALELPCCPALRDAEDRGHLLEGSWHRWAWGIGRLAAALDACS